MFVSPGHVWRRLAGPGGGRMLGTGAGGCERTGQSPPSTQGQDASGRRDWSGAVGRRGDHSSWPYGEDCVLCGRVLRPEGESCISTWPPGASGMLWAQLWGPCGMWPCHQRP